MNQNNLQNFQLDSIEDLSFFVTNEILNIKIFW